MLKSSVIDVLKTFTKEELSDFENFISSGYHNKNSIVIILYKAIKKYAPAFENKGLEKEILWGKIYKDKKYNYGIMKNLIFELKKLAEDYLSYSNWKKSSMYDKSLINELWERNAAELFLKKANAFNNKLDKTKVKDQMYYSEKLIIQPLIDEYNLNRILFNKSRSDTNDLLVESFLMHYLLNCFHLAVEMQKTKNKHDLRFLEYLLDYFKGDENVFADSPLLKIHFQLMLSFFDIREDDYFKKARNLFYEIIDLLPVNEIKNIYNILILLCLFKINEGKNEYRSIQLELNIEIANKKILSHRNDGSIELEAYRNIVKLAVNNNEYSILKEFINNNKYRVISKNPDIVVMYSDATLRFAEKEFEECLKICSKINFKDFWEQNNVNFFFKCDVKILQIKSHYELNHLETTISAIDSFKHFLKNASEINEQNKSGSKLLLNFLSSIITNRENMDKQGLDKTRDLITASVGVASKDWLLEKITKIS